MSGRTVAVGILAAICGIFATVGVTMLMNQKGPVQTLAPTNSILVAALDIGTGQKIESNMISSIPWHSDEMPANSFQDSASIVGKFAITNFKADELILATKIADEQTGFIIDPGKMAFTIATATPSSNVGANLTAGNRVDILWTTTSNSSNKPITVRLLDNVKILGIGQVTGEKDVAQRSLTFELKPKMDENLMFAQANGTLALSLRNPNDKTNADPVEITNANLLLKKFEREKNQPVQPTALEVSVNKLMEQFADLKKSLLQSPPEQVSSTRKTFRERIKKGMRGITIQTPTESTALAGILEPGDRIDLILTLTDFRLATDLSASGPARKQVPSETLIENLEILAVDTKVEVIEGDDEKKMSTSVSFIIKNEMAHDITAAAQMGTLTLSLRGKFENDGTDPRTVMTIDDFITKHMPVANPRLDNQLAAVAATSEIKIRTLRGGSVQEIPVSIAPAKN